MPLSAGEGWEADEAKRVSGSLTLFGLVGPHRLGLQASVPGRVSGVVLGLRALHPAWESVDVLVAVSLRATRGKSQPMFPSFQKAKGPGRDGNWGWRGASACIQAGVPRAGNEGACSAASLG